MTKSKAERDEERYENIVLQNSPERMIKTTLRLLPEGNWTGERNIEEADTNHQDWTELEPVIRRIWNAERERIFLKRLAAQETK